MSEQRMTEENNRQESYAEVMLLLAALLAVLAYALLTSV
jgi:hypothetical protein